MLLTLCAVLLTSRLPMLQGWLGRRLSAHVACFPYRLPCLQSRREGFRAALRRLLAGGLAGAFEQQQAGPRQPGPGRTTRSQRIELVAKLMQVRHACLPVQPQVPAILLV